MFEKLLFKLKHPFLTIKIFLLISKYKNTKICMYGAGVFADKLIKMYDFSKLNILGFIEGNETRKGEIFNGYKIYSLKDLSELNPDIILPMVKYPKIIAYNILRNKNVSCPVIYKFNKVFNPANKKQINKFFAEVEVGEKTLDIFLETFKYWLFLFPLAMLIPKKKNLIAVPCFSDVDFMDNTKYFSIYLNSIKQKENIEFYLITERKHSYENLKKQGFPVLFSDKLKTKIKLLRANISVFDTESFLPQYGFSLYKSKKVQLWHGLGIKKICYNDPNNDYKNINKKLRARSFKYDAFVSTSPMGTEKYYSKSFFAKNFIEKGHPRNDVFFRAPNKFDLIGIDNKANEEIEKFKKNGHKIIIYSPTFRDADRGVHNTEIFDFEEISKFCKKNKFVIIFKFHRLVVPPKEIFDNLIFYNSKKDIYPILPKTDLMITDYSSIYMDYLLTDKPVIFFCYDLEDYIKNSRELAYDIDFWTKPGVKCQNIDEVFVELEKHLVQGIDEYKESREEMKKLAFLNPDGNSSERIFEYIKEKLMV
ncbi:MAG: CDP-glycerol glycerophosphotransferase family protein [Candidatus Gastranaerophilales bacterium]|nr:CDP-glycerol glycerophosphotransferase family protein [Candidatus Gastranaerophilales bacterium]